MALRFGYFDSEITGVDSEGMPIFDRAENSELFRLLFANLISNGVLASPGNCFQVLAGSGLSVNRQPGFGLVKGAFAYDEAVNTLTLETAPTQYSRIDRYILRVNYADRCVEELIRTGTPAASPVAPELIRPTSGDYYELALADITVTANATVISQANIKDDRPDSSLCGYITQLIDHLDTSVFFDQLNAFYDDFTERSEETYNEFVDNAQASYNAFSNTINNYITELETSGDESVTAIVDSLREFQRVSQNAFNEWFATVQDLLDEDIAGKLINITDEHEDRLALLEKMIIQNQISAPIRADDDTATLLLADEEDNVIVADWKYAYA
ncbi:MAG: hypothetical protein IJ706_08240 [Clostridia bacterium]|nr:hypothetical protein [Clostridia bacterium]